MTDGRQSQDMIRLYLLGKLAGEERDAFEERLFTEDELVDEVLSAENDLIDDYLTGDLSTDEVAMFEKNFLVTEERRQKLRLGKAYRRYAAAAGAVPAEPAVPPEAADMTVPVRPRTTWNWQQWFSSPPLRAAAFAALILLAAVGVWRIFFYESDVDKGLIALNNAYREQRPIEGRITSLDWAPFITTRGPETGNVNETELRRAELLLLAALEKNSSPAVHHALGKVYLSTRDFDRAITHFDEATKGDSQNAQLFSDLGVAYLERAKSRTDQRDSESGKLQDLAHSLGALNRALELSSNQLEPLFNRGLVHQEMRLAPQAEEDWKSYLEKDSTSKWADEARRYLTLIKEHTQSKLRNREEILDDFLGAYEKRDDAKAWEIIRHTRDAFSAGKLIRDQLVDQYLTAASNGESQNAKSKLDALAFVGKVESQTTGDLYTSELAKFYSSSSPRQRDGLRQARQFMKMGQDYYSQSKPLNAIEVFNQAKQLFAEFGDRWESQYADLWIGYCHLNSSNSERSMAVLKPLATLFEKQKHKWHLMRTLHILSGAEYNLSEYSRALANNRRSLSLAEEMGDAIGTFNTLSILGEQYRNIGNYAKALDCVQRSLAIIDSCPLNEVQIAQHYGIVASTLSSSGLYPAAADYQKEAVRRALTTSQVQTIARAYSSLGLIYGKMGNYDEALRFAKLAYDTAKSHSDPSIKNGMMAFTSLQIGNLYKASGDINKAIASYDECLDLYKHLNNYYGLYDAHKNRLACYVSLKNDAAAQKELQTTLALVKEYRAQIQEGDNRNHFFNNEQSVYDLAIDFELSRMNNKERAFEYSEESRARTLLDLANSTATLSGDTEHPDLLFRSPVSPRKLSDIQMRMPDRAQILQYSVLSDRLLMWVISKTAFSVIESKVSQKELTDTIFNYLQAVSGGSKTQPREADEAKRLFTFVIKPVESLLVKDNAIYVVPDKALNYLPFSALISPDTNRFLVEDYLMVISPSSSLFINACEWAEKKNAKSVESVLSVGNPSFDRSDYPNLAELPASAREAEKITRYYPSGLSLIGDAATKPRILTQIPKADVLHFALHSVFDQRRPLRSKLLLAKQSGRSATINASEDVLEAHEIYAMKLPQARLVVLSACQSGVEQYFGGEGMISLARPFLAAGVPLVVASLWPVDSESTSELMISFHKHRKHDNVSSAEALRRAQLEMLKSSDDRLSNPYCWAGFTAVGGATTF